MAKNFKRSTRALTAEANAVCALLPNGSLRIYSGTQPATANTPITDQVLLVELRFGAPAFAAAVLGVATARPLAPADAIASGDATWFRTATADGDDLTDGSAGLVDCDMTISKIAIVANAQVSIASMKYTANPG
jgi:hypothetical protein